MKILLIAYDNGSYVHFFPMGLTYLAATLRRDGHEVEIYNQDIYHYTEKHLTNYLDNSNFNMVGMGFVASYYPYQMALKISGAVNNSKRRDDMVYVLGGHGPSPEPEYFLRKTGADVVVIGEGERTIRKLVKSIEEGSGLRDVDGIAYIVQYEDDDKFVMTKPRELIKNVDNIPFPAWDLCDINHYALFQSPGFYKTDRVMSVITGRGCPYHCTFCYRLDKGHRARSPESIAEEVKYLKDKYNITAVMFCDELLMTSAKRTIAVCDAIAPLKIRWYCNGRLNVVTEEILKSMKAAGCVFINYGVECLDDDVLANIKKQQTCEQIIKGVEATCKYGINRGLNVMYGNYGDSSRTISKTVEFVKKYDNSRNLRTIQPVTPYPGSQLYYRAIKEGRLKDVADFYENKHKNTDLLTINFTEDSDDEFYDILCNANIQLVNNYYHNNRQGMIDNTLKLYIKKNTDFRGFRQA